MIPTFLNAALLQQSRKYKGGPRVREPLNQTASKSDQICCVQQDCNEVERRENSRAAPSVADNGDKHNPNVKTEIIR